MNRTLNSLLSFLLLVLVFPFHASGQVATGTPPFGSFGGGPDVINLGNLNSHIAIPVLHKTGRAGMNFTYDLNYDTSVWYPAGGGWQSVGNWGWGTTQVGFTGSITYYAQQVYCPADSSYYLQYWDFWYADPYGISHHFSFEGVNTYISSDPNCGATSGSRIAADDSGLKLTVSGWPRGLSATIITSTGQTITPSIQGQTYGTVTQTDRNGNQLSLSSAGVFTDTLGTTVLSVSGSGTPSSPTKLTYTPPSGTPVYYQINYTSYTVQTNFHCNGIAEYGPTTNNLVSEIDLPDYNATTNPNSRYIFAYETTPGDAHNPHYVTGRIASVTLPTGGTISYSYSGGSNGIVCADGSTATLTRTTPDGTWTYAHSESGTAWNTLLSDPQGNQTNMNFQGIYETQRQVSQLINGSQTLLRQWTTCYNGNTSNCNTTAITLPIIQRNVNDQYGSNGLQCQHNFYYNSGGGLKEQDDYDYGSGSPGSLLRKTLIAYASLPPNITAFQQTVTICNGTGSSSSCVGPSGGNTGTVVAQTNYNYDETTPTATSGIAQHTSVSGSRGNLTSINYPVGGLTSHFTYYDTGSPDTSQDVNGATTTYNYSSNTADCQMAFPTSISEPLSLSRSMTWNCTGGVQLTAVDENNQTSTVNYNDSYFWRPASALDQSSNTTTFNYYTPVPARTELYMFFNSNNSIAEQLTTLDGLGRVSVAQRQQAPGVSNFDTVETDYDALGRPSRVTVPYFSNSYGQTNSSAPAQTQTYDALNRPLVATDGGGGTVTYTYPQNDVLVTVGPAPSGESTKRRQLEYDSLGRLTSVCEVTPLSGSGTCGQTNSQTGYWTKYSYDALGNLLTVTQNAQATSGSQQSRSYSYDAMSRLTSETNPESGTRTYVYDSDSTMCGNGASTSRGDLLKTVDANGNCVMRYYDVLHRVTDTGNNNQSATNPCKRFRYDNSSGYTGSTKPPGLVNTIGRLIEAATDACTTTDQILADEWFSYSPRGEISDTYESTPHSGGYYHLSQIYWPNGAPNVLSGNIGLPTFTYGVDGEGRTSTASASSGQNPVTSTIYNVFASPNQLSVAFGSGDSDVFNYDPNTFRLNKYQFNIGSQTVTGTTGWNQNGSLGTWNITDPFSSANTQNCSFAADDLARISQVNCGTIWGQNFSYDPFGNIQKNGISGTGGSSFTPTYQSSPITNRVASVGGTSATYDANGNSLNDTFRTFTWDADSNPITIGSVSLTYDAFDRMVEQSVSGTNSEIVYSPGGVKLALMSSTALTKAFIPLTGGATAVYNSSGLAYYRHTDLLGSSRFASTTSQTLYADYAYAPFGEPYASSGAIDPSFTGQNQDTTAGLYDFLYREHDPNQGRWTSPDPAGLAAANPADPQSWNRYSYVVNNPLSLTDPAGLCPGQPGCPQHQSGPTCINVYARANCNPLPPGACDWGGPLCGGWGAWYDILAIQAIPTQVPNPDWWTTGCIEDFDCGNIPAFLDVYTLVGTLFPGGSSGGAIAKPRSGGFNPNKVNSCFAKGLKETGLSIGLDVIGAIPALGNMVSASAATAHAIDSVVAYGGGTAGIATSLSDENPFGTLSASGGLGLALADMSLGRTKAIPLIGNFASAGAGIYDVYRFNQVVQACIAAP